MPVGPVGLTGAVGTLGSDGPKGPQAGERAVGRALGLAGGRPATTIEAITLLIGRPSDSVRYYNIRLHPPLTMRNNGIHPLEN